MKKVFLDGQPFLECTRVACRLCMATVEVANSNLEADGCCGFGVREVTFLLPLPLIL